MRNEINTKIKINLFEIDSLKQKNKGLSDKLELNNLSIDELEQINNDLRADLDELETETELIYE